MDKLMYLMHDPLFTFVLGLAVGLIVGSWFTENGNARDADR